MGGYAGTGKSTIANELAKELGDKILFAAYTGKAAHVLKKMGVKQTGTLHSLIYHPRDKCDQRLKTLKNQLSTLLRRNQPPIDEISKIKKSISDEETNLRRPEFTLNEESSLKDASLLVVDEYSMVDEQMGRDLLSFGCPILALGDPAQLPPVEGRCFFKGKPDMMLTEIVRQATNNPIIHLSMEVREGKTLRVGRYGDSQIIHNKHILDNELPQYVLNTNQLLVGLNDTRRGFNRYYRDLLGFKGDFPGKGERVICRQNNRKVGLFNGQEWTVVSCEIGRYLSFHLEDDDGNEIRCQSHKDLFLGAKEVNPHLRHLAEAFDFGYALTVHRAQGSQWNHVTIKDESYSSVLRPIRKEWLYTGITRAAEKVTIFI